MKVCYTSDPITTFSRLSPGDCFYRPIEPDGDIYMKTDSDTLNSVVNIMTGEVFSISSDCEVALVNVTAKVTRYGG